MQAVLRALHAHAASATDFSASGTQQRARALQSGALPAYAATSAPFSGQTYELLDRLLIAS